MKSGLAFLDYAVIAAFFAVMIGVGIYYSRKSKSSDQFFEIRRGQTLADATRHGV